MRYRIACALMGVLAACASVGHRWNHRALLQLRAGETTEEEAVAILGTPISRTNVADDQRILAFHYVAVAYVVTTEAKTVSLLFEDDRLVRIVQATNISGKLLDQVEQNVPIQSRIEVGGGQPMAR